MSKFVTAIAGSADGIKRKRAENTALAAKLAQEALINTIKSEVQGIEAALTRHLDIGPDSADSLRPVDKNFDAQSWVAATQSYKVSLKKAQERLDIAIETYNEWFVDAPAAAAR